MCLAWRSESCRQLDKYHQESEEQLFRQVFLNHGKFKVHGLLLLEFPTQHGSLSWYILNFSTGHLITFFQWWNRLPWDVVNSALSRGWIAIFLECWIVVLDRELDYIISKIFPKYYILGVHVFLTVGKVLFIFINSIQVNKM